MGANTSKSLDKLTSEEIKNCNNYYDIRMDPNKKCCLTLKKQSERNQCVDVTRKTEAALREYSTFEDSKIQNSIITEAKNEIEGFIEGNNYNLIDDKKLYNNTVVSAIDAKENALKTKGYKELSTEKAFLTKLYSDVSRLLYDIIHNQTISSISSAADSSKSSVDSKNSAKYSQNQARRSQNLAKYSYNLKNQINKEKKEAEHLKGIILKNKLDAQEKADEVKKGVEKTAKEFEKDVEKTAMNFEKDIENTAKNARSLFTAALGETTGALPLASAKEMVLGVNVKSTLIDALDNIEPFNGSIKEGLTESQWVDIAGMSMAADRQGLLSDIENQVESNTSNYTAEILAQKDNIVSKIIFDYINNNDDGSNVQKVYEQLNQEKNDVIRNNQIKTYYNKTYTEYIFILKVIICLILILLPLIFLNKYEMINKNISLIIIISIIILGFLFICYRLYILHMKDNNNFDKIKIPYDRHHQKLIDTKKSKAKGSILKNLGVVCIGDECCDSSMVYDNLTNKCIMSENFGNYFESMQNINTKNVNIIEPYQDDNLKKTEHFISSNSNSLENAKNSMVNKSLLLSSRTRMV